MISGKGQQNDRFLPCNWFLLDLEVLFDVVLVYERFEALCRHYHLALQYDMRSSLLCFQTFAKVLVVNVWIPTFVLFLS